MREDPITLINRIAAEVGLGRSAGSRHRYDVRFWQEKGDFFSFGYTPWRQVDGKFYALKYRSGRLVKKVAFGRRKVAKKRAYEWFCKRSQALANMAAKKAARVAAEPKKAEPTKIEICQKKIEHCEAKIKGHTTKLKRRRTLLKKWEKKKRYQEKRLLKLQGEAAA